MASPLELLRALEGGGSDLRVELRSALAPPVVLRPLEPSEGRPSPIVGLVRPSVSVSLNGVELIHVDPAGEPPAVPWLGAALVVVVVGAGAALFALGRASAR